MGPTLLDGRIDASVPAVVLRSGGSTFPQHGTLGVARSLGRLGVHVTLASPTDGSIAGSSRYVRQRAGWAPRTPTDADALGPLLRLGARRPGAVLIPTDDASAVFVDAFGDALEDVFRIARSPAGAVPALVDKRSLSEACERAGVATPRTVAVRGSEEAESFLDAASFPLVVKADLAAIRAGTARSVAIVHSRAEALDALARTNGTRLVLQEHIPGAPSEVNWMFDGSLDATGCAFGATGRKIAQYPAYSGMATAAVTERNEPVTDAAVSLLRHVGYVGPVDVDVRFDARDGRYKVIDVNPRIGGTFRLFVAPDGMDTIRATYLRLTEQAVPVSSVPDGRTWIVETHVLASVVAYRRDGLGSTGSWLRSVARVDEGALFGVDDLRPMLHAAGHAAARVGGRVTTRRPASR